LKTFLSKLGRLILVVVVVTFLTQVLTSLVPGNLEDILAPCSETPTSTGEVTPAQQDAIDACKEVHAKIRSEAGLDKNIFARYGMWLGNFVRGDLGQRYSSTTSSQPVGPEVKRALPISLELMLWAQLLALAIAIPLGVIAAYRPGKIIDRIISAGAFALLAMPAFALGLILAAYLGAQADLLPVLGYANWSAGVWEHLKYLVIPIIALSAGQIAVYLRLLRSDLIATLQQDFIAMAKAKGLSPRRILWRHALRPSSLTLLTVAGLQTGALIGGAVVIEVIFGIPGLGSMLGAAILKRQYIEMQSLVAIVAIIFVLVNFLVDYLYNILDPRLRHG